MGYSNATLMTIWNKSPGQCACCGRQIVLGNYANRGGTRGQWEVGHWKSRASGGSQRTANLWPMHVTCNRSMGAQHAGKACAPVAAYAYPDLATVLDNYSATAPRAPRLYRPAYRTPVARRWG